MVILQGFLMDHYWFFVVLVLLVDEAVVAFNGLYPIFNLRDKGRSKLFSGTNK